MIKKLGLIVMLIVCVTVGGVYASWTYANADIEAKTQETKLTMTEVIVEGVKGTVSVTPVTPIIQVENAGEYMPKLIASGSYKINYEPSATSDASEIKLQYTISVKSVDYATKGQILTAKPEAATPVKLDLVGSTTDKEILLTDIIPKVTVLQTQLGTKKENDAFATELAKCRIIITITEDKTV